MTFHPYDYINKDNFETIKSIITAGMMSNKTPGEIAKMMSTQTGIDQNVCLAILQAELLDTMKELDKQDEG